MSSVNTPEKHTDLHSELEAQRTNDTSQPALPTNSRRKLANPAPLGLLSFATSVFLVSITGIGTRGVEHPNVIVTTMIFFGGICQYISGIMEFIAGNTFGATVFSGYAGFNVAYALIFIPGTGILAAYSDPKTGEPLPELDQALALFVWAWFIISIIFTVAATRASWALLLTLICFDFEALLLAAGLMVGNEKVMLASRGVGFFTAALAYWAGTAGLWGGGATAIKVPVGDLTHLRR